jgi:predicted amino acid racemase
MFKKEEKLQFSEVRRFDENEQVTPGTIVRLPNYVLAARKISRNDAVMITNEATGEKTLRRVMGAGNRAGVTSEAIVLDYEGRQAIGVQAGDGLTISVRKATFLEIVNFYRRHPDPGVSVAMNIALISLGLGVLSLILTIPGLAG